MKTYKITQVRNNSAEITEDLVAEEITLSIDVNGKELVSLLCSQINIKELIIGYLYTNSLILRYSDILNIEIFQIHKENWNAQVEIKDKTFEKNNYKKVLNTGCGKGYRIINNIPLNNKINSDIKITNSLIYSLMRSFQNNSEIFLKTGGVHSSAIVYKEKIISFMEDIGRHNAIDKVIGYMLTQYKNKINYNNKIILTSGRISSEILYKILSCGFPIVISRSAPTDIAIDICRKANITLIGFSRGNKMNIYSGKERIEY